MARKNTNIVADNPLLQGIRQIIQEAKTQVQRAVNSAMVQAYWQVGRLIVEEEQQGEARAAYGKQQLESLAEHLTSEFGKGFDISNLRRMRTFYQAFPIQGTLCPELSWSHYRKLIRVDKTKQAFFCKFSNFLVVPHKFFIKLLTRLLRKLADSCLEYKHEFIFSFCPA